MAPDDDAAAAWRAIEQGAGGPQGLGLKRNYGQTQPLWLDDNRAMLWVRNWRELRQAQPPPTLADCEKLGRWIAAGGPGEIKTAWQLLSKGGAASNIGAWLDQAIGWDGVSTLRRQQPPSKERYPGKADNLTSSRVTEARDLSTPEAFEAATGIKLGRKHEPQSTSESDIPDGSPF